MLSPQAKQTIKTKIAEDVSNLNTAQCVLLENTLLEMIEIAELLQSVDCNISKCGIANINVNLLSGSLVMLFEALNTVAHNLVVWKDTYELREKAEKGFENDDDEDDDDCAEDEDDFDDDFEQKNKRVYDFLDDYYSSLDDCPPEGFSEDEDS